MRKPPVALILAAGKGTRLIPITNDKPKCLVEVQGKPLLAYQLETILSSGIRDVVVVIGFYGYKIINFIEAQGFDKRLNFVFVENQQFDSTASCYSLWLARKYLVNGYIHFNSDLITHSHLLLKLLSDKSFNGIITSASADVEKDMVRFKTNCNRIVRVAKYSDMPDATGFLIGPAKFASRAAKMLIDYIGTEISQGIVNNACYLAFGQIVNKIRFYSIPVGKFFWKEIDTQLDIREAEYLLSKTEKTGKIT